MDLMGIRRRLMMGQKSELYPIGTNLYQGLLFPYSNKVYNNRGELVDNSSTVSCEDYLEVDNTYTYEKSYRIYGLVMYDSQYNVIGFWSQNSLSVATIPIVQGTKYIRVSIHEAYINSSGYIPERDLSTRYIKRIA